MMTKKKSPPVAPTALDPHEALVCTMVLVAACDGAITDREISVMSGLVQTLPVFQDFSLQHLQGAMDAAVSLLEEEEGLAHAGELIRKALSPHLRETAYTLACEVIAAEPSANQPTLRMLQLVRNELQLDPLVAAAIERGTRARYRRAE